MPAGTPSVDVNVDRLVQEIRETVRHRAEREARRIDVPVTPAAAGADLHASLPALLSEAEAAGLRLGEPTAGPATLRGRFGAWVMRLLGRGLWWYTFTLRAAFNATLRLNRQQAAALDSLARSQQSMAQAIAGLERQAAEAASEHRREMQQVNEREQEVRARLQEVQTAAREAGQAAAGIERCAQGIQRCEQSIAHAGQQLSQLDRSLRQSETRLSELGSLSHRTRAELSLQERRITLLLEEARKRLPAPFEEAQLRQLVNQERHKYDAVYLAFEDVFRGTREEIKRRHEVYLPLLKAQDTGVAERPLLDLGCGRGEWLELLRANRVEARGVDTSQCMVESCRALELDVMQEEALRSLADLPAGSLRAVTAFHLVEHLPFDKVVELVDEALRVLQPGGLLILETPNPQNILVASHTFYLDPTHLRPLPSAMLRFFVEARGFCDVQVKELHPYSTAIHFPDDGRGMAARLNEYLYGPQDYAVIGRRP